MLKSFKEFEIRGQGLKNLAATIGIKTRDLVLEKPGGSLAILAIADQMCAWGFASDTPVHFSANAAVCSFTGHGRYLSEKLQKKGRAKARPKSNREV
jgi:hypothetical protein